MKTAKIVLWIVALSFIKVFPQAQAPPIPSHIQKDASLVFPRTQVIAMPDTKTGRQYELYIRLPEDYSEAKENTYPVLYYTDAMWHIEMLSGSTEYLMEKSILVGISWQKDLDKAFKKAEGAHVSRYRDYSIKESSNPEHQAKYQFGQANDHLTFIRNDVIPYVESTYRTDTGKRSYFGYSLGGLFGAYILATRPDTFANYILGSPSLKGDIPTLAKLQSSADVHHKDLTTNVFISYGTLEHELGNRAEEFMTLLKKNEGLHFHREVITGNHQTAFPLTVVHGIDWLARRNALPVIESPYLGEKPPGLIPQPFAPGRVTTKGWEYGGTFSPDLKEFYFIREVAEKEKQEFVVFQNKNEQWEASVISPRVGQPFIAPDGKTMHLGKRYKERTEAGWSEIERLGSPFEEIRIMRLSASSTGTYVFDEVGMPDGDGVIRYSQLINGKREAPKPFGKAINTGRMNAHPFIAPDESYLIWDGEREGGYGDSDLYISFKQNDGTWGAAINLGSTINTKAWEASGTVTPDGKYLFFNRNIGSDSYENVDIFWVDFIQLKKELIKKSNHN